MLRSAISRQACVDRDTSDPLASKREQFQLCPDVVYLNGHSLGCLPKNVASQINGVIAQGWGKGGVDSWHHAGCGADWLKIPARTGRKLARLIGAAEDQVVIADSLSVNLFKAVVSALRLRPDRKVVLTERGNFPTDLYIVESAARMLGATVLLADRPTLLSSIGSDIAVVVLSHVDYRSAAAWDMAEVSRVAHARGALTVFDLAHSAGVLDCRLDEAGPDFAVGCGYKYLNGGPGAPAFLYAARRHLSAVEQPLPGWFAHEVPFAFEALYRPAADASQFMCGTPPILSLAALDAALDAFDGVSMQDVEAKSHGLTELFIDLHAEHLSHHGFVLQTEAGGSRRGSHVAVSHEQGAMMIKRLTKAGFLGDLRPPNILRFGLAPPYTRFVDVHDLVHALAQLVRNPSPPLPLIDA